MNEETPKKTRNRQVVRVLSDEMARVNVAGHTGERLWDRKATTLHLIRAVSVPGTSSMVGTQGISQIWLRPKGEAATPLDRSTGYITQHDQLGLEIQLEERTVTGVQVPCGVLFVAWSNVAGITGR